MKSWGKTLTCYAMELAALFMGAVGVWSMWPNDVYPLTYLQVVGLLGCVWITVMTVDMINHISKAFRE